MKKKLKYVDVDYFVANYHSLMNKESYTDSPSIVQQDGLHQISDLVRHFEAGLIPVNALFPDESKEHYFEGEFDEKDIDKLEPDEDDIEEELDEPKKPEPEPKKPEPEPVKEEKKDDKTN